MESRDDVETRRQQRTWAPMIEMDRAPIPYESMIRESSRGHSMYLAQALEQPFLLLKDMDALSRIRQPDLFISLKGDLAMVNTVSSVSQLIFLFHSYIFFMCNPLVVLCRSLNKSSWSMNASKAPTINSRSSLTSDARWRRRLDLSRRRRLSWPRSSKPLSINVKTPWQGLRSPSLKLRTSASFFSPQS